MFNTILNIIKSKKCPNKLIISSNNDLPLLRTNLNKLNFMIKEEKVVLEKNHYYVIMLCLRGIQKLKKREILFGISNDKKYYEYLYKKNKELIKKVPFLKKINFGQRISDYVGESHRKKQGTPTMGGIIIAITSLIMIGILYPINKRILPLTLIIKSSTCKSTLEAGVSG